MVASSNLHDGCWRTQMMGVWRTLDDGFFVANLDDGFGTPTRWDSANLDHVFGEPRQWDAANLGDGLGEH